MIGVGRGGVRGGALAAMLVLASTVALTVLLGYFVFRPLIQPEADPSWGEPGERVDQIRPGVGEVDSIDRPKYWGEGPVIGPAFDPQDQTYPMTAGGASWRMPWTWSCRPSEPQESLGDLPGDVKASCVYDLLGPGTDKPSGVVTIRPCEGPCSPGQERRKVEGMGDSGDLPGEIGRTDPTTVYMEWEERREGRQYYYLSTRHFWDREGEGRPDALVITTFSAPAEDEARVRELQKSVNDVREAT